MSVDLRMNLADDLLLYTDKMTMHHSLECRVPILDLDLVRFQEALPAGYRVRLRHSKVIHKDFACSVPPETIVNRKKKGFQSPTIRWFRAGNALRDTSWRRGPRFRASLILLKLIELLRSTNEGTTGKGISSCF